MLVRAVYSSISLSVVDTPEYLQPAGVLDRCEVAGGSFFESVPPGGDLYILKRVMHDWSDDVCAGILRRCHDAVAKDQRIVVIDAVVPPGNAPHLSKTVDLLMMYCWMVASAPRMNLPSCSDARA
jgi:hypothetical protein